jgi:hypothetical protein
MTPSVFIKGCRDQMHWLCYCLQFMQKNWQCWSATEVVVKLDSDCEDIVKDWGFKGVSYVFEEPWKDRYMHALWSKACADDYTHNDPIMLLDCDTFLDQPAGLKDYLMDGKLALQYLPWDIERDAGREVAYKLWPRVFLESTGLELPCDYMVSRPWIFWRSTFAGARSLIETHKGLPFKEAVYSEVEFDWRNYPEHPFRFCDLEALGYFAAIHETERYWVTNYHDHLVRDCFKDMWSHTPFTSALRKRLDEQLAS